MVTAGSFAQHEVVEHPGGGPATGSVTDVERQQMLLTPGSTHGHPGRRPSRSDVAARSCSEISVFVHVSPSQFSKASFWGSLPVTSSPGIERVHVVERETRAQDQHVIAGERPERGTHRDVAAGSRLLSNESWITGIDASGYINSSGMNTPWSKPRFGSRRGSKPAPVNSSAAGARGQIWRADRRVVQW